MTGSKVSRIRVFPAVLALLAAAPSLVRGQERGNVDSLISVLASASSEGRGLALAWLAQVPREELPAAFAPTVITLLEREALNVDWAAAAEGEGYGEYILELVDVVERLGDPRALRGMSLLGIQSGRSSKEFVASYGARALPHLDEAWQLDTRYRHAVLVTFGYMLGPFGSRLTGAERRAVLSRLFRGVAEDPQGFVYAIEIAGLPEATPVVERIVADREWGEFPEMRQILDQTRRARDSLPLGRTLRGLVEWQEALCLDAAGARRGVCESLGNLLAAALGHMRAGRTRPAIETVEAFADRARAAERQGALGAMEVELLAANADYVAARLPRSRS